MSAIITNHIQCVVPENIPTQPMDGYWKFRGGVESQRTTFLKERWGGGGGVKVKKTSVAEVRIFSLTTH